MTIDCSSISLGVVPVLIGPLQVLLAMLPAILIAIFSTIISLLRPSVVKNLLRLLWRLKLQVGAVALAIAGLWWGLATVFPASTTQRNVDGGAEAGRDWPLFRGNLRRNGHVPGTPDPASGGIRWRFRRGGEAYLSSPAVVGNRVYFTTATIQIGRGRGEIVCLDADTGQVVWKTRPDNYDATFSSPAISGEYLVVGEGLHTTTDARVICLSLAPGREGEILWSYQTASHVESTPVIYDGKVYVGAGDKEGYYCFALEGDGKGNPKVLWHRYGKDFLDAETSIAAADGRFYAGLGNEGKALVELDADTGEELRRIEMPFPVFSPPAIADGKLYVGCGNGDFAKTAEQLGLPAGGKLVCVDQESFRVEWSFDLPETVLGSPAVGQGKVFAGCRNGELFVLTTDGTLVRRHDTGASIMTSPALAERTVYVISTSGVLQGFDVRSGRAVWERIVGNVPTGTDFGYISSPAVARGHVYLGTQHHGFLCVGEPGEPRRPVWGSPRGGDLQGSLDGIPLPTAADFVGNFPADRQGQTSTPAVKAAPALMGRYILTPLADAGDANGLACLTAGAVGFAKTWHYRDPLGVHTSPVAVGTPEGGLYRTLLVTGRAGDAGRSLVCLDADGNAAWRRAAGPLAGGMLHADDRAVYAQVDDGETLTKLSLDGQAQWAARVGPLSAAPRRLDSMLVCPVGGQAPAVVVLDAPTGRVLFRKPLKAGKLYGLSVGDSTILAVTDRGVLVVDPAQPGGEPRAMGPPASSPATPEGERLWYVSEDGRLVKLDTATGKTALGPPASPAVAPLIVARRLLYVDSAGEIRMLATDAAELSAKPDSLVPGGMTWLGKPTTPLLTAGGRVYVGLAGWGLCLLAGGNG
ncbi:MAG: PQQ-binding-like beta-propeller repeat protein [Phycisphaerae bacterium]